MMLSKKCVLGRGLYLVSTAVIAVSTVDATVATHIEQKDDMIDNRTHHFGDQYQASTVAKREIPSGKYVQFGCTDLSKVRATSLVDRLKQSVIIPAKKFCTTRLNDLYNLIKINRVPVVTKLPFEGKIHKRLATADRITGYSHIAPKKSFAQKIYEYFFPPKKNVEPKAKSPDVFIKVFETKEEYERFKVKLFYSDQAYLVNLFKSRSSYYVYHCVLKFQNNTIVEL